MVKYINYIYLFNCLLIISICLTGLKKIKLSYFSTYGICLVAFPPSLIELIDLFGLKLSETTLITATWLPVCLLGINLALSAGPLSFRPAILLLMVPTLVALLDGLILDQTTKYPMLFLFLSLPFLRTYASKVISINVRSIVLISIAIRLAIHSFSFFLQSQPQVGSCRADKCNFFGAFITPFGLQSNFMSMTFALMATFLLYFLSGKKFLFASIAIVVNTDLAGGRTGLFASIVSVLTVLLMKSNRLKNSRGFHSLVLFFGFVISLIPVVFRFPSEAFSERGFLWELAKFESIQSPFLGAGPSFWVRLGETTSTKSFYSAHNLWLEIAASTGIIAALCFFVGFARLSYTVPKANREFIVPIVISFLMCGTLEVPVLPYRVIQNPSLYLLLLYLSALRISSYKNSEAKNGKS